MACLVPVFLALLLNWSEVYIFRMQCQKAPKSAPLMSSVIFQLGIFMLLLDIRLYPRSFRILHWVPLYLYELLVSILILETAMVDIWFPLEALLLTQLPHISRLWKEILKVAKLKIYYLCLIADILNRPATKMACSYLISVIFLACVLHATRAVDFRLFRFKKDENLDPESELIITMKRAVLLTQRGEYDKAERMLHISLRMAQNQNNQKGITYIYDLMANLALDRGEFNKSKLLFINVIQRLFEEGVKEDDIKVIHISLKLARLSQYMSEFETAESGYHWCLEKLKKSTFNNDPNALLLYGITCDWYGQFLLRTDRAKDAVTYFKSAYETCIKSKGVDTEQAIMLMNDIGTAEWYAGNLEEADKYLRIALKQSNNLSDKNITTVIKVNLGMVCLERGLIDDAQINCKEAWKLAKECENESALNQANHCINVLKNINRS